MMDGFRVREIRNGYNCNPEFWIGMVVPGENRKPTDRVRTPESRRDEFCPIPQDRGCRGEGKPQFEIKTKTLSDSAPDAGSEPYFIVDNDLPNIVHDEDVTLREPLAETIGWIDAETG
jgi:hypothetical protein